MEKESSMKLLVFLVCLLAVFSVVTIYLAATKGNVDEQALADKVTAQVISKIPAPEKVPTAAEIAAEIKIPEPTAVSIPEMNSDDKVNDLWENLYADEIEELETKVYDVAVAELEDHDYKLLTRWLEVKVEGFDERECVDNYEFEDCHITIVNLGLEDEEDKVAVVNCELKVEYTLKEGVEDDFKKTVPMNATVTFDKGEYDDEDVKLVFA